MPKVPVQPVSNFETVYVKRDENTPVIPSPISMELRDKLETYGGVTSKAKKE